MYTPPAHTHTHTEQCLFKTNWRTQTKLTNIHPTSPIPSSQHQKILNKSCGMKSFPVLKLNSVFELILLFKVCHLEAGCLQKTAAMRNS